MILSQVGVSFLAIRQVGSMLRPSTNDAGFVDLRQCIRCRLGVTVDSEEKRELEEYRPNNSHLGAWCGTSMVKQGI